MIVSLNASHKKDKFNCGKSNLDNYLHNQAKQDVKRKLAACFVLADNENTLQGYYTLSSSSVDRSLLPLEIIKKLPVSYFNLPCTLLRRLAVDLNFKGRGFGELLLVDALRRSYITSLNSIGSMAVVVDPLGADAELFYLKFGFIYLPNSGKMFLPMITVGELFK